MIRVPFGNGRKKRVGPTAVARCVQVAADKSGHNEFLVAMVMTHFLEAIADETCRGNVVSIPGFGMFGPCEARNSAYVRPVRQCYPGFSAQNSYRRQLAVEADPDGPNVNRIWRRASYVNHAIMKDRRTYAVMERFRRALLRQAESVGMEV